MRDRPLVSVLLPVRNGERFLDDTLRSIFEQTLPDWELIVVLDGPNANCEQIVNSYTDERISLVQIPHAVGLAAALNRGLQVCTAPYVARIDADDLCARNRLERQAGVLESRPALGVLGSAATLIDASSRVTGLLEVETGTKNVARGLLWRNMLIHSSVMARRTILLKVGGYNSEMRDAQDYELWLRLLAITEIDNLPERLVSYRRHDDQMSLAPMLKRQTLRRIGDARLAAAEHVGVTRLGSHTRGAAFMLGQLRWEVKRRLRLRQLLGPGR